MCARRREVRKKVMRTAQKVRIIINSCSLTRRIRLKCHRARTKLSPPRSRKSASWHHLFRKPPSFTEEYVCNERNLSLNREQKDLRKVKTEVKSIRIVQLGLHISSLWLLGPLGLIFRLPKEENYPIIPSPIGPALQRWNSLWVQGTVFALFELYSLRENNV